MTRRSILIVGGGTAGWLTAAYLAKYLAIAARREIAITVLESPEIGIIGVGEGAFPTIRSTLAFLGIDERRFIREAGATFKQGIRFVDWAETPGEGRHTHFLHPFEPPFELDGTSLAPYWLVQNEALRPPFAEAVTIQNRVAEGRRAPKRSHETTFGGPLNYAYHFDARKLADLLAERARELGVRHLSGELQGVELGADGAIVAVKTEAHGRLTADFYIDCSGFRAELIGGALGSRLTSVRDTLFTNRALACKLPYERPDSPLESYTVATAHAAGWIWDIGLAGARGIGCVYSSDHLDDMQAEAILRSYVGPRIETVNVRTLPFEPGYREQQWVKNCVAIGLAAGFLEPLESTGIVLIEAAAAMIAELFPANGPIDAPAGRFNTLMAARFESIVGFLKLHYCLSRRDEPFWRANRDPATIPERLRHLLGQWRYRPPSRFDFTIDVEPFAFFNYQYILYGMGFHTEPGDLIHAEDADPVFARIRGFAERAAKDLPSHRTLIEQINAGAGF